MAPFLGIYVEKINMYIHSMYIKNEHGKMFTAVQQGRELSIKGQRAYILGFTGQSVSVGTQLYHCREKPVTNNT